VVATVSSTLMLMTVNVSRGGYAINDSIDVYFNLGPPPTASSSFLLTLSVHLSPSLPSAAVILWPSG
jgi:hypothetical protein